MLFSDYKSDPIVVGETKYRVKNWHVKETTSEAFKLGKVITPMFTVMADLKLGKSDVQSELDEIYQEKFDNEFMFTQAFAQVRELLEEDHFVDLEHKLLSCIEMKDEQKDEWVSLDWGEHLSNPKYRGDYLDLFIFSFKENLWAFMKAQHMFRSLTGNLSPLLSKLKTTFQTAQVEKASSDQDS